MNNLTDNSFIYTSLLSTSSGHWKEFAWNQFTVMLWHTVNDELMGRRRFQTRAFTDQNIKLVGASKATKSRLLQKLHFL